ncbi:S1C family serine protease [Brevibacillus sp. SYSU BS000544]|uniref:S1C family serine protease n=1 Tax=Brevibacillus sp. SYSU BS000544 TaxID=3416443 RepID=UPI003CE5AE26
MKRKKWSTLVKRSGTINSLHPLNFLVPLVEQVKDSVVSIITQDVAPTTDIDKLIQNFLGIKATPENLAERSFGSGFIIHPKGYILTSEHVIGKSKKIMVKLCNGRLFEGKMIYADAKRDFAILKIQTDFPLYALPLGDSSTASVGEWVISVGAPLGLENSVTAGIISAKNRRLQVSQRYYEEIFQTDAAINPGNSGGPLINLHGEVIGLNAFIIQSSQSLGFAIGINSLKPHIQKGIGK